MAGNSSALFSVTGDLSLRFVYVCEKCGARALGERQLVRLSKEAPINVKNLLDESEGSAQYMPIGWCSYAGPSFRCPECI